MLAVIADVTKAPDRTPITGCEHAPTIEHAGRIFIDATMRTLSCEACTLNAFELDPDAERLMNQDVWCDLCGVNTGRPVDQGGGTWVTFVRTASSCCGSGPASTASATSPLASTTSQRSHATCRARAAPAASSSAATVERDTSVTQEAEIRCDLLRTGET